MTLFITPSADRINDMVEITGDPETEIRQHLAVDVIWALANVSVSDWIRAIDYAAYDRKCSIAGLMFWPVRDLAFDIFYNAATL